MDPVRKIWYFWLRIYKSLRLLDRQINFNKTLLFISISLLLFLLSVFSRPSWVEGGHHRVSSVSILPATVGICGSGLLFIPDEAAPPLQLPRYPLLCWCPGLPWPAEGCSRLHHGGYTFCYCVAAAMRNGFDNYSKYWMFTMRIVSALTSHRGTINRTSL